MDNNCAAVAFPDFTRGHWMDVEGYDHAYSPNDAEAEAAAKGYTEAQRAATVQFKLWELYDAVKVAKSGGNAAAIAKAEKRLVAAKVNAQKGIAKQLATAPTKR